MSNELLQAHYLRQVCESTPDRFVKNSTNVAYTPNAADLRLFFDFLCGSIALVATQRPDRPASEETPLLHHLRQAIFCTRIHQGLSAFIEVDGLTVEKLMPFEDELDRVLEALPNDDGKVATDSMLGSFTVACALESWAGSHVGPWVEYLPNLPEPIDNALELIQYCADLPIPKPAFDRELVDHMIAFFGNELRDCYRQLIADEGVSADSFLGEMANAMVRITDGNRTIYDLDKDALKDTVDGCLSALYLVVRGLELYRDAEAGHDLPADDAS